MSYISGKFSLVPLVNLDADYPTSVLIRPQKMMNPNYIDIIITYSFGTKIYRTNHNVGSFYAYYNDVTNVQYLTNPRNIQVSINVDTGAFTCLTRVEKNIVRMNYQLV